MNEDERRCIYKAKRKRQKKRHKKQRKRRGRPKSPKANTARGGAHYACARVDQEELAVCNQERNATRAVSTGSEVEIQHQKILNVKERIQRKDRKVLQRKQSDAKAMNSP